MDIGILIFIGVFTISFITGLILTYKDNKNKKSSNNINYEYETVDSE